MTSDSFATVEDMATGARTNVRIRRSAVLAAALLGALALVGVAAAARGYNASDFRLKLVSSSLGTPQYSGIEFDGTISSRAYAAGLRANVHFVLTAKVTCAPASDPSQATTGTVAIDSQIGGFVIQHAIAYHPLPGGTIAWVDTMTFPPVPFDDFDAVAWCPATGSPNVLEGFSLVEAKGTAWLAQPGISPEPGTTVYAYDVGAGSILQKPHPAGL